MEVCRTGKHFYSQDLLHCNHLAELGELLCRLWVRRTLPSLRASAASASWAWPTDSLLPWHLRASAGRKRCSSCARTIRSADSCRPGQAATCLHLSR